MRELQGALRRLRPRRQQQHALDYDDLLLHWWQMMTMADGRLARVVGSRFDHVLVDEYRTPTGLQAAILHALKPDGRGLTVVGDDAQAIYAFRAAEVRNISTSRARVRRSAGARRDAGAQPPGHQPLLDASTR